MIPNNIFTYRLNIERKNLDNILHASIDNTVSFISSVLNWHNNRLLPLLRQFFRVPNKVNNFIVARLKVTQPVEESDSFQVVLTGRDSGTKGTRV
jgi:hypothetical protein